MAGIALSSKVLPNDITAGSKLSQITLPLIFSSKWFIPLCVCVCVSVKEKKIDKVQAWGGQTNKQILLFSEIIIIKCKIFTINNI